MLLHEQYRGYGIDQLLQALEVNAPGGTNSLYLESLLSVRTAEMVNRQLAETARVTGASANAIGESIGSLTTALQQSSTNLQAASRQSAALGSRLNWLTAMLVTAALISAAATAFYAWETKRLVDLTEQQLQHIQPAPPPRNSPLAPTPKH